jgi:peptidase E
MKVIRKKVMKVTPYIGWSAGPISPETLRLQWISIVEP